MIAAQEVAKQCGAPFFRASESIWLVSEVVGSSSPRRFLIVVACC